MVERLFLAVPRGCLWFVIVVFPDHIHLQFLAVPYLLYQYVYGKIHQYIQRVEYVVIVSNYTFFIHTLFLHSSCLRMVEKVVVLYIHGIL